MNQNGLSLVELLIVIVVISVATIMGYPMIQNLNSKEVARSVVFSLVGNLGKARLAAIGENSDVVVIFSKNNYYSFVDNGGLGGSASDWVKHVSEKQLMSLDLPSEFILSTNFSSDRIRFKSRINMSGGTILVKYKGDDYAKVIVSSTGRVRVEK
ncbi:MAG: prepilin-type N-terminal cleavage/methylation domain-containing protein [Desulfotalea sp.]